MPTSIACEIFIRGGLWIELLPIGTDYFKDEFAREDMAACAAMSLRPEGNS